MTDTHGPGVGAMSRRYHRDGTVPDLGAIWVFGSNLAGRHGAGAAKVAKEQFGARYGVGVGATGRAYAIPTKDGRSGGKLTDPAELLSLDSVRQHIEHFIEYARANPGLSFTVTRVGCGLAAFADKDIAPLFACAPANCTFAQEWRAFLESTNRPTATRLRPR